MGKEVAREGEGREIPTGKEGWAGREGGNALLAQCLKVMCLTATSLAQCLKVMCLKAMWLKAI